MSNRWTIQDLLNKGFSLDGEKASKEKPKKSKYGNQKQSSGHDSKSEKDFANRLKINGIKFEEKQTFELASKFEYLGETILPIRIQPDFIIYKGEEIVAIVDTKHITAYGPKKKDGTRKPIKGTEEWRIKIKMLKRKLMDDGHEIPLFFPVNAKEKQETIDKLLEIIK